MSYAAVSRTGYEPQYIVVRQELNPICCARCSPIARRTESAYAPLRSRRFQKQPHTPFHRTIATPCRYGGLGALCCAQTEEKTIVEGWASNPATWIIGSLSLLSVVIGASIAFGTWKGKVDTNQSHFKTTLDSFMVEIRADIKRIFERLPSETVSGASPLRLTAKGRQYHRRSARPDGPRILLHR